MPELISESKKDELVKTALRCGRRAYAPYSKFHVGASVLTTEGEVFGGCNVENGAYPVGVCAEKVAISNAVVSGFRAFVAVVVASNGAVSPCGNCRQFISEFGSETIIILVELKTGEVKLETTIGELLPNSFQWDFKSNE